MRIKHGSEK
jgi:hypothetical protein